MTAYEMRISDWSSDVCSSDLDFAFGGTINTAPLARDDDLSVAEDVSIAFDKLANDEDVDGDPLAVTILTGPVSGTLTPPDAPGGSWTYTPDADFFGDARFTSSLSDALNPPAIATVSTTVPPVNDAPVMAPVAYRSTPPGDPVTAPQSA